MGRHSAALPDYRNDGTNNYCLNILQSCINNDLKLYFTIGKTFFF